MPANCVRPFTPLPRGSIVMVTSVAPEFGRNVMRGGSNVAGLMSMVPSSRNTNGLVPWSIWMPLVPNVASMSMPCGSICQLHSLGPVL